MKSNETQNFCNYTNQENHNVPESLPQQTVKYNRREREREQSRVERRGLLKALRRRWFKSEGVKKPIFVGIPEKVEEVRNPFMIIPLSEFCTFVEFCRCCHCCDVHGFSSCSSLDLGSFHWPKPNLNGPLLVWFFFFFWEDGLIYLLYLFFVLIINS